MQSSLTIYKASAGSGKTFTLAIQYIKTLIAKEGGRTYSHILAVTFTNKATAEMKDRILQQLYGIWKGLPSSAGYLNALRQELYADGIHLSDQDISKRAGVALCQILHDYNRFRVETIDSFFQSVMKNLAHELSLTANLKVDLNDKEVLNAAVDRLMERLHLMPNVLNWILEYVDDRITNNERWDIAREVKGFAAWIFKEAYLTQEHELRQVLKENKRIAELRTALNEEIQASADIVQSAVAHFREELENYGITCDRFKFGSTMETYLKRLESGQINAEFGARLQGFADNPDNLLKKTDAAVPEWTDAAVHFSRLLADLRTFQEKALIRHTSASLSLKHLNPLRLLGSIDEEGTALNHENNRFLLAKTPILLNELIEENDAPFIFEKMGSFFRHVMIDEFQDTSTMQWNNFKILLLESISAGFGNLIVGDVKQSIYRWRNGDWTILKNIGKEMGRHRPDIRSLKTNHRSERRIICFNNMLFTTAAEELDRLTPDAEIKMTDAYSDVVQECPPHRENRGYVQVRFFDEKADEWETRMLDELCEQVGRLHDAGRPYNEMAILLRFRRHADPIIRHFADRMPNVKIVSDEAFLLSSSLAVNRLIAAQRYLADPEDKISLAFLALHTGQAKKSDNVDRLMTRPLTSLLPDGYLRRKEELKMLPLYELQEELYKLFRIESIPDEDAYLFAYFDCVTAYLQENPSDLDSFLTYWDETLCKNSIPSGEVDGIRIFTVHQSKGLQFHTVFVPYCDWNIERDTQGFNRRNDLLWCKTHDVEPYNILPVIPITIEAAMRDSIFSQEYAKEHLQRRVDALNTLYVTFTRAEKNLYAWCRTRYTMDERSTTGDLIYHALPRRLDRAEETFGDNGETELYVYGRPVTETADAHRKSDNRMETEYQPVTVKMESYKAHIDFCQSNRAEQFMETMFSQTDTGQTHSGKRLNGILLHKIFSTIYTRNDVERALLQLETEGQLGTQSEKEQLRTLVEKAFTLPEVAHWFDGTMKLYNECPILSQQYHKDTGKYGTYRPDRVMFAPDEITVVDFKFGVPRKEYNRQVADYMKQLSLMEPDKQVKGYLWYILQNKLEEVQA
ncbi:MAG: UvrD-helicase domain-containing protein [Paraprevotella sp.]|nr:UvrD-helicase domain-containing protein [Paraprevotella sp.]